MNAERFHPCCEARGPPALVMENSRGMKFRPIPRSEALMCIWETRIRDYKVHAAATPTAGEPEWMKETGFTYDGLEALLLLETKEWRRRTGASWRNPGWEIQDDDPVAGPCWLDAAGFCTWLTWEERRTGRIRADQAYRLPTDEEWSAAAGFPEESGATAVEREASWPQSVHFWIWGPSWPAPEGVVNAAGGELAKEGLVPANWATLPFSDPWPRVAPVEALPASALGFCHLCGNVEEWTESLGGRDGQLDFVLRGASWSRGNPRSLTLNKRAYDRGVVRTDYRGFRVVFQRSGAEGWRYAGAQWRGKTAMK